MRRIPLLFIAGLVLCAISCDDVDSLSLSREDLFTINLGKLENQFDFFFNTRLSRGARNSVYFDDGIFYVINGNAQKVMAFSLLGELTMLYYNPDKNPSPVLLPRTEAPQNEYDIIARRAVKVNFTDVGAFGIDSAKNIYMEDEVPEDQGDESGTGGANYRKIIRRFDRLGRPLGTIGRTGVDGLPFPAIEDLYLIGHNHLVVVCRTSKGLTVYWMDEQSRPLYEVEFDYLRLPSPPQPDVVPTLSKIVPDYHERKLYVMITCYANVKDESTRLVSRVNHFESLIYTFDLQREKYDPGVITIPAESGQRTDPLFSQEKQKTPLPYSLLGISENNHFYLMKMKNKTTYELLVMDTAGHPVKKIRLFIDDTDMVSADFHISKTGLLYALIAEQTRARIVRWRTDRAVSGGF
jgi:hypothetical protein